MPQTGCDQQHRRVAVGKSPHHASPTPDLAHDPLQRIGRADLHPRFCDWPKQARCKAREVQVYAHSASPLNAADYLFSTIPKGLRIGCFSLQMWLSHFGAKDGQLHCISTFVCAQHDTNTCQFSNAKSRFIALRAVDWETVSENMGRRRPNFVKKCA